MMIFAAYVALVMRWSDESDVVVQYETNGRTVPQLGDTIGYFATPLFLRVQADRTDRFSDLLMRVTSEYCNAYEHHDCGYLEGAQPQAPYVGSPGFNWVPRHAQLSFAHPDATTTSFRIQPIPFAHPMIRRLERDSEPVLLLSDLGTDVRGDLYYPASRFSAASMRHFVGDLLTLTRALMQCAELQVWSIPLSKPVIDGQRTAATASISIR
jgi:hypothetical protein